MRDTYTFRMWTEITVTKEDVIDDLIDNGFFDVDEYDEDGEYVGTRTDEEAVKNYEPDYDEYEKLAHKLWENDECEYYGPDPIY